MQECDSGAIKIIRDPVHGYIDISEQILESFIDTAQFQRLRNIEQTNLHVLFPSATHTRFEHSIGVYHLGKNIFDSIFNKQAIGLKNIFKKYRNTVLIACLLHDIGHAPFSHIGEEFFSKSSIVNDLKKIGIKLPDVKKPANHELMSCLVALKNFKKQLGKYAVDISFFCRLITGVEYEVGEVSSHRSLKNALINILSGAFDADKMDYIMRDAQSAGIGTVVLDVQRIIKSFNIVKENKTYIYVIEKSGFSVANGIVDNRNYMFYWAYGHHKVQYHYELLRRYLKALSEEYKDEFKKLFSYDAITGSIKTAIPHIDLVSYVDDNDISRLIKYIPKTNTKLLSFYRQVFERAHYRPLWKSKPEFDQKIKESPELSANKDSILALSIEDPEHRIEKNVISNSNGKLKQGDFMIFARNPKLVYPKGSREAKFYFPGNERKICTYKEVFNRSDISAEMADPEMLYIFVRRDKPNLSNTVIKTLKKLSQ